MADKALKNLIRAGSVTFVADSSIAYDPAAKNGSAHAGPNGKAVAMKGDGVVGLVATGETILGKLNKVEPDGFCSVQDDGYADLPTDGTAITFAAGTNGVIGGATAGTVKSSGAAAVKAQAIQSYETGRVIVKIA